MHAYSNSNSNAIQNNNTTLSLNKSITSESPTKMSHQKINISIDNPNPMKLIPSKRDSPIKVTRKIPNQPTEPASTTTLTTPGNSNNNGLIINVILKGNNNTSTLSNPNPTEQGPVRKKSSKDLVLEPESKPKESIKLSINKGCSSATNKSFKKMAVNVSYDSIQQQQQRKSEIPLMKANLTKPTAKNVPPNSAFITLKTPSNQSNSVGGNNSNVRTPNPSKVGKGNVLSTSSFIKKGGDTRISVNIKNLNSARENYKNFKEKLMKFAQQNLSQEALNENMKKSIQGLLTDFSQNQYMLTPADQSLVQKLQDLVSFNPVVGRSITQNPPQTVHLKNPMEKMRFEEKTRSNSVMVFDKRGQGQPGVVKEESKRNEEEILLLLNNKKFGRISSDRINSDHHKSAMIYHESGS